uniref:Uncharacterized protein n=1 Tax=Oryza meridionalis TaxID=40149 RepID=A0A0E0CLA4_9ORYZ
MRGGGGLPSPTAAGTTTTAAAGGGHGDGLRRRQAQYGSREFAPLVGGLLVIPAGSCRCSGQRILPVATQVDLLPRDTDLNVKKSLKVGNGLEESTSQGPLINEAVV